MAKTKDIKTNAMRILDAEAVSYTVHTYDTEDGEIDGVSVARKCGENPEQVFKTLVTRGSDGNYYVFAVPSAERLDLKKAAAAVNVKNVEMIHQKELFPLTGYIHGGCSPVGMKKQFRTVFDETILLIDTVMVSGGKVGIQIEVLPSDLIRITAGETADITRAD